VIDLGTEFGVSISEAGETEVAVFHGMVDLALDSSTVDSTGLVSKRLHQGEATRVGDNGKLHRVFAITSGTASTSGGFRPNFRAPSTCFSAILLACPIGWRPTSSIRARTSDSMKGLHSGTPHTRADERSAPKPDKASIPSSRSGRGTS